MVNLKELTKQKSKMRSGHRMCPGCGAAINARMFLMGTTKPVVVANATGCLEVSTTVYPYTAWNVPWIHNAFENAAATMSGVVSAYEVLKKKGKVKEDIKFIAFGGDGGTYDIGLQSLSGAAERGHDFLYVCYNNEAYMNTGVQRSSATPYGAATKTDPFGTERPGKQEFSKDLTKIMVAHNIPYVAQTSISHWNDLIEKSKKAFEIKGPKFINSLSPCIPGWGIKEDDSLKVARLAVETCFWPLYEVENGKYKITYDPGERKKPVVEFLKTQKRFAHLLNDKEAIKKIQEHIDKNWENLKKLEKCDF